MAVFSVPAYVNVRSSTWIAGGICSSPLADDKTGDLPDPELSGIVFCHNS
jgi:hypothetical protein